MNRFICGCSVLLAMATASVAEERFVIITKTSSRSITFSQSGGGRGRGRFRGRGVPSTTLEVSPDVKITAASRERRTGKFRVGVTLAGGLRHHVFWFPGQGLSARLVTENNKLREINVLTEAYDVNQSTINPITGEPIIAVRPKRPPTKR